MSTVRDILKDFLMHTLLPHLQRVELSFSISTMRAAAILLLLGQTLQLVSAAETVSNLESVNIFTKSAHFLTMTFLL